MSNVQFNPEVEQTIRYGIDRAARYPICSLVRHTFSARIDKAMHAASEVQQDVLLGDAVLHQNLCDLLAHLLLAAQHRPRGRAIHAGCAIPRKHILHRFMQAFGSEVVEDNDMMMQLPYQPSA